MLELTETAKNRLHRSLATSDQPDQDGRCFRIVPKDEKYLTLKIARPEPSDTVFTHEGETILAVPKALQPSFEHKTRCSVTPLH